MQIINTWPDMALNLPKSVAQDLHQRLLEPFDSEASAKAFCQEAPSTLIILNSTDTIEKLQHSDAWNDIEFALTYPEYDVPLKNDYVLLVAIANDGGSGIYLVVPPELSNIITEYEAVTHE